MNRIIINLVIVIALLSSCVNENKNCESKKLQQPIIGTWKLVSVKIIANNDTTFSDYTKNVVGIKTITKTHFSFFQHDLNKGKNKDAIFISGGGKCSFNDNKYTEYLEYCSYREMEDNKFEFDMKIKNDTLIQMGIEKVASLGINKFIIETYVRM